MGPEAEGGLSLGTVGGPLSRERANLGPYAFFLKASRAKALCSFPMRLSDCTSELGNVAEADEVLRFVGNCGLGVDAEFFADDIAESPFDLVEPLGRSIQSTGSARAPRPLQRRGLSGGYVPVNGVNRPKFLANRGQLTTERRSGPRHPRPALRLLANVVNKMGNTGTKDVGGQTGLWNGFRWASATGTPTYNNPDARGAVPLRRHGRRGLRGHLRARLQGEGDHQ
jgi:hypothetical protein